MHKVTQQVIKRLLKLMQDKSVNYAPVVVAELAPGVVCLKNEANESDVIFCRDRWYLVQPAAVDHTDEGRKLLTTAKLGVLYGRDTTPLIKSIEEMTVFVRELVEPIIKTRWYGSPNYITSRWAQMTKTN